MNIEIVHWLKEHRSLVLTHWAEVLATPAIVDSNGVTVDTSAGEPRHNNGQLPALSTIYDGLLRIAQGDINGLNTQLHETNVEDSEQGAYLANLFQVIFQLRRAVYQIIQHQTDDVAAIFALAFPLDELLEHTISGLTQAWTVHTDDLIKEREFIAESLDSASASADQRALQLKALNDISQQLSANLEAEQLLDLIVSSLVRLTDITHVAIWLIDFGASDSTHLETLRAMQTHGTEQTPVTGQRLAITTTSDDLVLKTYITKEMQFEPQPNAANQGQWYQSGCGVLAFPIVVNEAAIGVVGLQDPRPVEQLRYQQDLAQGVVSQAAIALQNAQLYTQVRLLNVELEQRVAERTSELQDERDRLSTIREISTEVSSTLDLDSLLNTSLEVLARITHAEYGSIMMIDSDDGSLLETRAVLGQRRHNNVTRFAIGSGIAGWVAQNRQSTLVNDVSKEERWINFPGSSRKREGAMIAVPLVVQGEVLGVLVLSHTSNGFFNEDHLRLLNACAGAIAIGINNANLFTMISTEAERRYELLDRQQKESSQIAAILQSLADGVIVCDMYGSVLSANLAAGKILQRSVEDLVLWNLHSILQRYLGAHINEMPLEALLAHPLDANEQPQFFVSTFTINHRVVSTTMGPVLKENGELLGALVVLRDITREVEADRMKIEFIGTMSHELRTPMTAIKGFTQLLAMGNLGPLNDTQSEFVTTIHSHTERMIDLINDVLDITKIESSSIDLELRSLHLAEVLSGVMSGIRPLIISRQHHLTITIPPGLPLVRADALRLHQVMHNLLSNAVKYTPNNGTIEVAATIASLDDLPEAVSQAVVRERRYVRVDICDSGVGIDAEDLNRIFDRFYRTENPLMIEAGGTGLGLSLVKPLVELLGGRIWVASELGVGSTFSFLLPAAS